MRTAKGDERGRKVGGRTLTTWMPLPWTVRIAASLEEEEEEEEEAGRRPGTTPASAPTWTASASSTGAQLRTAEAIV